MIDVEWNFTDKSGLIAIAIVAAMVVICIACVAWSSDRDHAREHELKALQLRLGVDGGAR